jgi:hypothetical protein
MKKVNNLLIEYQLILEYKRAKELILIENFINSVSESLEITYDEDATISDILESVDEYDFSDNLDYLALEAMQTPAQKKAAKQRSMKAGAKPKPNRPKPKMKSKSDIADKLGKEKTKIKEQLNKIKEQKAAVDFKTNPKKARDLSLEIKKLTAKKYILAGKQKNAEGDSDKSKAYMSMGSAKSDEAKGYEKWKDVKQEIASTEDKEAKMEFIQTAIESKIEELTGKLNFSSARKDIAKDPAPIGETIKKIQEKIDSLKSKVGEKIEEDPTGDDEESEDEDDSDVEDTGDTEDIKDEEEPKDDSDDLDKEIEAQEKKIEDLESKVEELRERKGELKDSIEYLKSEGEPYDDEKSELNGVIEELNDINSDIDAEKEKLKSLKADAESKPSKEEPAAEEEPETEEEPEADDSGKEIEKLESQKQKLLDQAAKMEEEFDSLDSEAQMAWAIKNEDALVKIHEELLDIESKLEELGGSNESTKWLNRVKKSLNEDEEIDTVGDVEDFADKLANVAKKGEEEGIEPEDDDAKIEALEDEIVKLQQTVDQEKVALSKLSEMDPPAKESEKLEQSNKIKDAEIPLKKKQAELKKLQGDKSSKDASTEEDKSKAKKEADEKLADEEYDKLSGINQEIEAKKAEMEAAEDSTEKAKLKGELDKLIFNKRSSEKKIADLTGRDIGSEEASDKAKSDEEKKNGEDAATAEDTAKEEAEIKDLEAEVENMKEKLEATLDAQNEEVSALMDETKAAAGSNPLLTKLVTKLRLENRLAFNREKAKYITDTDQKAESDEEKNEISSKISDADSEIKDSEKKSEDKAEEDATPEEKDKLADATEQSIKDDEEAESDSESDSEAPKTSSTVKVEAPEIPPAKATKPDESPKDYKVRMTKEKRDKMYDALDAKQKEIENAPEDKKESMQKAIDAIESNIKKAEDAINKAETSSNESFDLDLWTANALLSLVEAQLQNLEDEFLFLND